MPVVAATNVWGDVVRAVAGSRAWVTSIITDPAADPHSYEASARNAAAVASARLVLVNGGGYDEFMQRLLAATDRHPRVINAVALSGKSAPPGGDLNEHVWYDFPTVAKVAAAIATNLSALDPAGRTTYTTGAHRFIAALRRLETDEARIRAQHAGAPVAITEPVPLYLLQACGLVNVTPPAFSHAVEDGSGVPASVLAQTLTLFTARKVRLLAYNEQTSSPETRQLLATAKHTNIPVVPVTETLPPGQSYLTWMRANLTALTHALADHR
jgi:zinc/manganese transport system substrate-binding protein